ncbi:MAG: hypothetical protein WC850_04590 [Candidatus Gracilibacteria bacterium]
MYDIKNTVNKFLESRNKNHRYSSFDYCYNYFYNFYVNNKLNEIGNDKNIEKSCLHLGFYLASWGMMRGSSFLLQKNLISFRKLIQNISNNNANIYWDIDIDNYNDENITNLLKLKDIIYKSFGENKPSDTLITKIMLGIFGNIPAFDRFFKNGMKINSVNRKNLYKIKDFYLENKTNIDSLKIRTLDFNTGKNTNIFYTKAKIIDMYGFMIGLNK